MSGYQELANAIIVQAAKDYREALDTLREEPDDEHARKTVREVERFFHSKWYGILTNVDPDYIINKLREEMSV